MKQSHPVSYWRVARARDLASRRPRLFYRLLEILPGAIVWLTFGVMILAARFAPFATAVFIILFDLYWFLRTVYLSLHLRTGFQKVREHALTNWIEKLNSLSSKEYSVQVSSWRDIWHLVILPMYQEPYEIVRPSFQALVDSGWPTGRLIVILALEERAGKLGKETGQKIEQEFASKFSQFLVTHHPADLAGEIPGKGSNERWAMLEALEKIVDRKEIPHGSVIVSVFDADTAVFPGFFSCLTYHYLTDEKPLRTSFQPVPLFINNVWQAPAFARVMGFSSTFWQMMQQARPERLITFSSHSMGLKPLVEIGFWQGNVVSEDSRIFYQCFLFYNGDWKVTPLFFPVAMDANFAGTFWGTLKNQYLQQRRWGYGAENIPYTLFGFANNNLIPLRKKLKVGFSIIEGFHSWATNAIIIFFLGWLPIVIGKGQLGFGTSLISYNLLLITQGIMIFAMVGMVTSATISILLLPPRPREQGSWKYLWMFFQWLLMPLTMIFLSAIPAIDAQTRLMLGKYLGFWTTPKARNPKHQTLNPKQIPNSNL